MITKAQITKGGTYTTGTITYRAAAGEQRTGEIWSPGPWTGTVWVLDTAAPLGAVVVRVRDRIEATDYRAPRPCPTHCPVTDAEAARAREIRDQAAAYDQWHRTRSSWMRPDRGTCPPVVPEAEATWARETLAQHQDWRELSAYYRESHWAARSVADRTFFQLALVPADDGQAAAA